MSTNKQLNRAHVATVKQETKAALSIMLHPDGGYDAAERIRRSRYTVARFLRDLGHEDVADLFLDASRP